MHRAARKEDLPRQRELFQRTMAAAPLDPVAEATAHYQLGRAQAQHRRFVAHDRAAVMNMTEQAEVCFSRCHEIACANGAAQSDLAGLAACEVAHLAFSLQLYPRACEWFAKGFDVLSDESHLMRSAFAGCYGYALFAERRYDEAERLFDRYLAEVQSVLPDRVVFAALVAAGVCAALHGDVAHGLGLLDRGAEAAAAERKSEVIATAREWRAKLLPLQSCATAEDWKVAGNGFFAGGGDLCAAICLYDVALGKAPFDAKVLANRALCAMKLGRLEEALADATRARRADRTYKRALMILANVEKQLGRLAAAETDCAALLAMDADDAAAKQLAAEIKAAIQEESRNARHVDPSPPAGTGRVVPPLNVASAQQTQRSVDEDAAGDGAAPTDTHERTTATAAAAGDASEEEEEAVRADHADDDAPMAAAGCSFFANVPLNRTVARQLDELRATHATVRSLATGPKSVLPGFLQWYRGEASEEERVELLKSCFPFLPDAAAATDAIDPVACLVPEVTAAALCRGPDAAANLKRLVVGIAGAPDADAVLEQAASSLLDTAEFRAKTARGAWLKAQLDAAPPTLFTELASGRMRDSLVDPNDVPAAVSRDQRRELAALRTALEARLAVSSVAYALATTRASYLLQLPEAWLCEWLRRHEPEHPLAAQVAAAAEIGGAQGGSHDADHADDDAPNSEADV